MENKNYNRRYVYVVLVFAVSIAAISIWINRTPKVKADTEALAACLAAQNITMYGADWCPHCQNEKSAFGDAFKLVPYVECPADPQRCIDAGVKGYPTWIWPGGKKLEGEQGLEKLAEASGCPLKTIK